MRNSRRWVLVFSCGLTVAWAPSFAGEVLAKEPEPPTIAQSWPGQPVDLRISMGTGLDNSSIETHRRADDGNYGPHHGLSVHTDGQGHLTRAVFYDEGQPVTVHEFYPGGWKFRQRVVDHEGNGREVILPYQSHKNLAEGEVRKHEPYTGLFLESRPVRGTFRIDLMWVRYDHGEIVETQPARLAELGPPTDVLTALRAGEGSDAWQAFVGRLNSHRKVDLSASEE